MTRLVLLIHLLSDSAVRIANKITDTSTKGRDINYSYYLSQARDIIHSIEYDKVQTSLF